MASAYSHSERIARVEERLNAFDRALADRERQVAIAQAAVDKATDKAEQAQQRVNTSQNEFRGALKDQAATLATRESLDRALERIVTLEKIASVGSGLAVGKGSAQTFLFQLLPLIVSAIALAAMFWKKGSG